MFRKKTKKEECSTEECEGKKKDGGKEKHPVRETLEAIAIALLLALVIRTFALQAFKIPSSSMEDTLIIGDHLLVNKLSYGVQIPKPAMVKILGVTVPFFDTWHVPVWGEPEKGDIIVFRYPHDRSKDYIKRVVATEGDSFELKRSVVYINNKKFKFPKAVFKGPATTGAQVIRNTEPYIVPEGHVFVMGDNRDRSYDSRYWGPVQISEIKGKALVIYWSPIFGRILDSID